MSETMIARAVSQVDFDSSFTLPELFGDEGEYLVVSRGVHETAAVALAAMLASEWAEEFDLHTYAPSQLQAKWVVYGECVKGRGEWGPGDEYYEIRNEYEPYAMPVWVLDTMSDGEATE